MGGGARHSIDMSIYLFRALVHMHVYYVDFIVCEYLYKHMPEVSQFK